MNHATIETAIDGKLGIETPKKLPGGYDFGRPSGVPLPQSFHQ
jgi:hypothetical protein